MTIPEDARFTAEMNARQQIAAAGMEIAAAVSKIPCAPSKATTMLADVRLGIGDGPEPITTSRKSCCQLGGKAYAACSMSQ